MIKICGIIGLPRQSLEKNINNIPGKEVTVEPAAIIL
jgi:hypothetical protein